MPKKLDRAKLELYQVAKYFNTFIFNTLKVLLVKVGSISFFFYLLICKNSTIFYDALLLALNLHVTLF